MKDKIKILISIAENIDDIDTQSELFNAIEGVLGRFASTINCPSNWRSIGEELAEEYKDNKLVYDSLELWDYEEW